MRLVQEVLDNHLDNDEYTINACLQTLAQFHGISSKVAHISRASLSAGLFQQAVATFKTDRDRDSCSRLDDFLSAVVPQITGD